MLSGLAAEQQAAQSWIEAVTGSPFEAEFAEELKDGSRLCALINAIKPGTIKKINPSKVTSCVVELCGQLTEMRGPLQLAFKQMENVSGFISAARGIGLADKDVFDTIDLYEAKDIPKVIMCIHAFGGMFFSAPQRRPGPIVANSLHAVVSAGCREGE